MRKQRVLCKPIFLGFMRSLYLDIQSALLSVSMLLACCSFHCLTNKRKQNLILNRHNLILNIQQHYLIAAESTTLLVIGIHFGILMTSQVTDI